MVPNWESTGSGTKWVSLTKVQHGPMPRHARLQRMIGVLQQMVDTMRSRLRASPLQAGLGRGTRVYHQRCHIEWLCDRDIEYASHLPICIS